MELVELEEGVGVRECLCDEVEVVELSDEGNLRENQDDRYLLSHLLGKNGQFFKFVLYYIDANILIRIFFNYCNNFLILYRIHTIVTNY